MKRLLLLILTYTWLSFWTLFGQDFLPKNTDQSYFALVAHELGTDHYGLLILSTEVASTSVYANISQAGVQVAFPPIPAWLKKESPRTDLHHLLSASDSLYDQIAIMSRERSSTNLGSGWKYLPLASHISSEQELIVMERNLSSSPKKGNPSDLFEKVDGALGERLLRAARAVSASAYWQSARLQVISDEEQVDLRIDFASQPFVMLQQAYTQQKALGQVRSLGTNSAATTANQRLDSLQSQLAGFWMAYPDLIQANLQINRDSLAADLLSDLLRNQATFRDQLPRFHALNIFPIYQEYAQEEQFSLKDWQRVILSYLALRRVDEAILYINRTLKKYPKDAFTYYLMGQAYERKNNRRLAKKSYKKAIKLDAKLTLAAVALEEI